MYIKLLDESKKELEKLYDKPFYVYLSLSNICNANCIFCDVRQNKLKKCSIDVYKLIDDLKDLGTKYIQFTGGGEPFINDDIFDYIEYCTQKNIKIIFISNGLNLNEEKIKRLSKYNIHSVIFSLDSNNPLIHDKIRRVNGIWNKVTENINLLKKYIPNVNIVLNHVLNKENIDYFEDFMKLKEKYNFDYINPLVVKDCDEVFPTEEQIKKYSKNVKKYYKLAEDLKIQFLSDDIDFFKQNVSTLGDREKNIDLKCVYPSFCAFVDAPSGFVYPCDCSIHRDRKLYKIGDLHQESFKEIWNGDGRKNLKEMLLNSELNCKLKCDEANCLFNRFYLN